MPAMFTSCVDRSSHTGPCRHYPRRARREGTWNCSRPWFTSSGASFCTQWPACRIRWTRTRGTKRSMPCSRNVPSAGSCSPRPTSVGASVLTERARARETSDTVRDVVLAKRAFASRHVFEHVPHQAIVAWQRACVQAARAAETMPRTGSESVANYATHSPCTGPGMGEIFLLSNATPRPMPATQTKMPTGISTSRFMEWEPAGIRLVRAFARHGTCDTYAYRLEDSVWKLRQFFRNPFAVRQSTLLYPLRGSDGYAQVYRLWSHKRH